MTTPRASFTFHGEVWLWRGEGPWYFVSLPEGVADDIEQLTSGQGRAFGSVRVGVQCQDATWQTSLFPDRKSGTYLLPLKKEIRRQLGCDEGSRLDITVTLLD